IWDEASYNRIDEGYPLEAVIPEDGVGYDLDVVWMFKDTDNRELAEEVIDYIGSEEGMEKSAEHRSMVTKPGVGSEEIEDYLIDYDRSEEHTSELQSRFD